MDNLPVYGCEECKTATGRMGCNRHSEYSPIAKIIERTDRVVARELNQRSSYFRTCPQGHIINLTDNYCGECGERIKQNY